MMKQWSTKKTEIIKSKAAKSSASKSSAHFEKKLFSLVLSRNNDEETKEQRMRKHRNTALAEVLESNRQTEKSKMKRSENEWTKKLKLFHKQSSTKRIVRKRNNAIDDDQPGRRTQTAKKTWKTIRMNKKKWRMNQKSEEAVGLYISKKRQNGREAALHSNRSRQICSEIRLSESRKWPSLRRPLLYNLNEFKHD